MSTVAILCVLLRCLLAVRVVEKIACLFSSQVFSLRGAMPKEPYFTLRPGIHDMNLQLRPDPDPIMEWDFGSGGVMGGHECILHVEK